MSLKIYLALNSCGIILVLIIAYILLFKILISLLALLSYISLIKLEILKNFYNAAFSFLLIIFSMAQHV